MESMGSVCIYTKEQTFTKVGERGLKSIRKLKFPVCTKNEFVFMQMCLLGVLIKCFRGYPQQITMLLCQTASVPSVLCHFHTSI